MFISNLFDFFSLAIYGIIIGLGIYIALLVIKALRVYIRNNS